MELDVYAEVVAIGGLNLFDPVVLGAVMTNNLLA